MLILSRKPGEEIMIGDDVKITILPSKGNFVRVGISAPLDITVHRIEIYNKIKGIKTSRPRKNTGCGDEREIY